MRDKPEVIFVGAFPPPESGVHGGQVTSCRALLEGGLGDSLSLSLVDSTLPTLPAPPTVLRIWPAVKRVLTVWGMLRRNRPDAIILFAGTALSIVEKSACGALARAYGSRALLFIRGGEFVVQYRRSILIRFVCTPLLRACQLHVCQTQAWQRFLSTECGIPLERCVVVENWTASSALLAIGSSRGLANSSPLALPLRLVFVGWLDVLKGVPELLDAIHELLSAGTHPAFTVQLCGEGTWSEAARALVQSRGLQRTVEFTGWLSRSELHDVLRSSDIFVLPSHHEGLPNAMIEAMSAGLPVIVTPVGGIPDVITDQMNGLLVPVNDPRELASAIGTLLRDAALRRRLGDAAYSTAKRRFGVEHAITTITRLVLDVPNAAA